MIPDINQRVNSCFDTGKSYFFFFFNLRNILFIGFVKFEIKQWFSAYQDQVCAWFSLARLPTEAARKLFLYHFQEKKRLYLSLSGFSILFNASARHFCTLSFAQSRKILSLFSKLSAILKLQRENLCNDDVNRASVL